MRWILLLVGLAFFSPWWMPAPPWRTRAQGLFMDHRSYHFDAPIMIRQPTR